MRCVYKMYCKYGMQCKFYHTPQEKEAFQHPIHSLILQQNNDIKSIINVCNKNNDHFKYRLSNLDQNINKTKHTISAITHRLKQKFSDQMRSNDQLATEISILKNQLFDQTSNLKNEIKKFNLVRSKKIASDLLPLNENQILNELNDKIQQQQLHKKIEKELYFGDQLSVALESSGKSNDESNENNAKDEEILELIAEMQIQEEINIINDYDIKVNDKIIKKLNNEIKTLNNQLTNDKLQINIHHQQLHENENKLSVLKSKYLEKNNENEKLIEKLYDKIYEDKELIDYSAEIISEFKERENKLVVQMKRRNNGLRLCKNELEQKDEEIFNMRLRMNDIVKENNELQINNKILNDKFIELNNQTNINKNKIIGKNEEIKCIRRNNALRILKKEEEVKEQEKLHLLNDSMIKQELNDKNNEIYRLNERMKILNDEYIKIVNKNTELNKELIDKINALNKNELKDDTIIELNSRAPVKDDSELIELEVLAPGIIVSEESPVLNELEAQENEILSGSIKPPTTFITCESIYDSEEVAAEIIAKNDNEEEENILERQNEDEVRQNKDEVRQNEDEAQDESVKILLDDIIYDYTILLDGNVVPAKEYDICLPAKEYDIRFSEISEKTSELEVAQLNIADKSNINKITLGNELVKLFIDELRLGQSTTSFAPNARGRILSAICDPKQMTNLSLLCAYNIYISTIIILNTYMEIIFTKYIVDYMVYVLVLYSICICSLGDNKSLELHSLNKTNVKGINCKYFINENENNNNILIHAINKCGTKGITRHGTIVPMLTVCNVIANDWRFANMRQNKIIKSATTMPTIINDNYDPKQTQQKLNKLNGPSNDEILGEHIEYVINMVENSTNIVISDGLNELNNDILAQNCVNLLDEMSSSGVLLSKLFYGNVLYENELTGINNDKLYSILQSIDYDRLVLINKSLEIYEYLKYNSITRLILIFLINEYNEYFGQNLNDNSVGSTNNGNLISFKLLNNVHELDFKLFNNINIPHPKQVYNICIDNITILNTYFKIIYTQYVLVQILLYIATNASLSGNKLLREISSNNSRINSSNNRILNASLYSNSCKRFIGCRVIQHYGNQLNILSLIRNDNSAPPTFASLKMRSHQNNTNNINNYLPEMKDMIEKQIGYINIVMNEICNDNIKETDFNVLNELFNSSSKIFDWMKQHSKIDIKLNPISLRFSKNVITSLQYHEQCALRCFKLFYKTLRPGFEHLNGNSLGISSFIEQCVKSIQDCNGIAIVSRMYFSKKILIVQECILIDIEMFKKTNQIIDDVCENYQSEGRDIEYGAIIPKLGKIELVEIQRHGCNNLKLILQLKKPINYINSKVNNKSIQIINHNFIEKECKPFINVSFLMNLLLKSIAQTTLDILFNLLYRYNITNNDTESLSDKIDVYELIQLNKYNPTQELMIKQRNDINVHLNKANNEYSIFKIKGYENKCIQFEQMNENMNILINVKINKLNEWEWIQFESIINALHENIGLSMINLNYNNKTNILSNDCKLNQAINNETANIVLSIHELIGELLTNVYNDTIYEYEINNKSGLIRKLLMHAGVWNNKMMDLQQFTCVITSDKVILKVNLWLFNINDDASKYYRQTEKYNIINRNSNSANDVNTLNDVYKISNINKQKDEFDEATCTKDYLKFIKTVIHSFEENKCIILKQYLNVQIFELSAKSNTLNISMDNNNKFVMSKMLNTINNVVIICDFIVITLLSTIFAWIINILMYCMLTQWINMNNNNTFQKKQIIDKVSSDINSTYNVINTVLSIHSIKLICNIMEVIELVYGIVYSKLCNCYIMECIIINDMNHRHLKSFYKPLWVTDNNRRTRKIILGEFICRKILSKSGKYYAIKPTNRDGYIQYIKSLDLVPESILHINSGSGKTKDEIVNETAYKILKLCTYSESMSTVLVQEEIRIIRYNKSLHIIKKSLKSLLCAIKAEIVMTNELEIMANSLFDNIVPDKWQSVAYQSLQNHARKHVKTIDTISFDFKLERKDGEVFSFLESKSVCYDLENKGLDFCHQNYIKQKYTTANLSENEEKSLLYGSYGRSIGGPIVILIVFLFLWLYSTIFTFSRWCIRCIERTLIPSGKESNKYGDGYIIRDIICIGLNYIIIFNNHCCYTLDNTLLFEYQFISGISKTKYDQIVKIKNELLLLLRQLYNVYGCLFGCILNGFIYVNDQKMFNENYTYYCTPLKQMDFIQYSITSAVVDLKGRNNNIITELVLIWFIIFIQSLMFIFQPIYIILAINQHHKNKYKAKTKKLNINKNNDNNMVNSILDGNNIIQQ